MQEKHVILPALRSRWNSRVVYTYSIPQRGRNNSALSSRRKPISQESHAHAHPTGGLSSFGLPAAVLFLWAVASLCFRYGSIRSCRFFGFSSEVPTIYKPLCFFSGNRLYVNLKFSVPANISSVLYPHQGSLKDPFEILLPPEVRENIFLKPTV